MSAFEADLRLMEACDQAIQRCDWCEGFGHPWKECQVYEEDVKIMIKRETLVKAGLVFLVGLFAGVLVALPVAWEILKK